ncbi:MAG: homoserine dehydrogenase [bacterium]|nr:homoserine dehydrogenase [bacterium]
MVREIGIALIGIGTVGSKVLEILRENEAFFAGKYEIHFQVHVAYVRDVNKRRTISLERIELTSDVDAVVNHPGVDLAIECMGGSGAQKTYEIICGFLKRGIHVVLSSKKCFALYKNELLDLAKKNHAQLRLDATVGGSIPICKVFQNLSGFDSVQKIYGIANVTTNYILTVMKQEGLSYEEAVERAKQNGYAENDISDDIEGWDALYKMCILLRMGAAVDVDPKRIAPCAVTVFDELADIKKGEVVKQIFYAERVSERSIRYYVGPMIAKQNSIIGDVEEQHNIIVVEHKYAGKRAYYGPGAGGKETAAIMVEDVVDVMLHPYEQPSARRDIQMEQIQDI